MRRINFALIIVMYCGILQSCAENPSCTENQKKKRLFEHVVIIGIDGLTVDGLKQAETPVMDNLIANGAVKYNVRPVLPTSSLPNWGAMVFGAGPEATGITSNGWQPDGQRMSPVVKNQAGLFPTIFDIVREQLPEAEQGAFFEWSNIEYLIRKDVANRREHYAPDDEVTRQVCSYITSKKPVFLFVQLSEVDYGGHGLGFQSTEYLQVVSKADGFVGRIMESIRQSGMENNTLVIVVSDHGGIGKGHGGESVEESNVPYIYYGKGVKKNYTIQQAVYSYDVAANVAFALNLKTPYAWTGRPTLPAFEGYPEPE